MSFSPSRHLLPALLVAALAVPALAVGQSPVTAPSGGDALSTAARLAAATVPGGFVDDDGDGIDDNAEQRLANLYAPVIFIEPDESNYPVNVEWFLQRVRMEYHEDCGSDIDAPVGPNPLGTQENLIGSPPYLEHPNCGTTDSGYDTPPHHDITTTATDPDGKFDAGTATTGYSDQQTFVLPDLPDEAHVGSLNPADWKTYFHAYPTAGGGIMLQYWHLFAYNNLAGLGFGNHGGDWDATIHVQLKPDLTPEKIWYSRHGNDHPGDPISMSDVTMVDNTHPLMTIDGGGHAAYASPQDFCTHHSFVGGSVAWPTDLSDWSNPARLGTVLCLMDSTDPVLWNFTNLNPGGTVWRTWDGGGVVATANLTHQITTPSGHGGMVNLGEYNPCTATTCFMSNQASKLLAGQFRPLNGQIFIRYEGKWGNLPHGPSPIEPPRGPVFQGVEENGFNLTYKSWYNQGADNPASPAADPWRVAPTVQAAYPPGVMVGSTRYVTGDASVALTVTQNPIAARFGVGTLWSRVYKVGDAAPDFAAYTSPLALPSQDGTYQVDYYGVDALGNTTGVTSLTFTRDATPPTVAVSAPTNGVYPHSGTLTLDYGANDGAGSGVATVTATLDGSTTVDGQPVASGTTIDLLTALSLGSHTLVVTATDKVGNAGTTTVTFTVTVTPRSIADDVDIFASRGEVGTRMVTPLRAKLDDAAQAREAGDCLEADSIYRAFVNQVRAQTGKQISPAAAAILTADAQYLRDTCTR